MRLPTVKITADNERGWKLINESAFDASKHSLYEAPVEEQEVSGDEEGTKTVDMTVAELKAALDKRDVKYAAKATKPELLALFASLEDPKSDDA